MRQPRVVPLGSVEWIRRRTSRLDGKLRVAERKLRGSTVLLQAALLAVQREDERMVFNEDRFLCKIARYRKALRARQALRERCDALSAAHAKYLGVLLRASIRASGRNLVECAWRSVSSPRLLVSCGPS